MENQREASDAVLELIRKCLALTSSPNEHEAAAAMAKAQELLEKYNLTTADIKKDDPTSIPDLIEGEFDYNDDWEVRLFSVVAKQNFCRIVYHPSRKKISTVGRYVNVVATVEMGRWIRDQALSIAKKETDKVAGNYYDESGYHPKTSYYVNRRIYKSSFLLGMVERIKERLEEMAGERQVINPGIRALTVNLLREAELRMHVLYPMLGPSHLVTARDSAAYQSGRIAGNAVSLIRPSRHIGEGGQLKLGGG